jgi:hypothetical protein
MKKPISSTRKKIAAVALCAACVSALHFALGSRGTEPLFWHMFLNKLYFFPVLLGAVWFGLSGGLGAALAATGLYSLHLWYLWPRTPMALVDHAGEAVSFLVLGLATGLLVTLERRARNRSLRAHRRAERDRLEATVAALVETIAVRDPETGEHSRRVAELARAFAMFLGLSRSEIRALYLAGLLHDIGKVGVPDDILLKAESLSREEWQKIREHPEIGEKNPCAHPLREDRGIHRGPSRKRRRNGLSERTAGRRDPGARPCSGHRRHLRRAEFPSPLQD